jgi:iron complex transport system ATP-binding protein
VPGADLRVDGVGAGYGARPVLHHLTLTVGAGEVVGLIGPNGSGKSTLIRVASRGLAPATGTVRIGDVDPYALPARRAARLVAVVPQDVAPAFAYTVLEVVLMGRSPYLSPWGGGSRDDWAIAREAMARTDVEHLADRALDRLSGGERQRVVLAQALAQRAPLLLLDEPTTHLDLRHVIEVLSLVRQLARSRGTACLAVFHDLNLAAAYCDRIYALSDGRIAAEGEPAEVITANLLRAVFGVDAEVFPSPTTGLPIVSPVSEAARAASRPAPA